MSPLDEEIVPRPAPVVPRDVFRGATGIGASAFAPVARPRFSGGVSIKGVPVVTRSLLNELRRAVEGAIVQSVAARLTGGTVAEMVQVVNTVVDRPLQDRFALKVVQRKVDAALIRDLSTTGHDFLANTDFAFPDGNPTKGKISFSGLVLFPGMTWHDRSYYIDQTRKDTGGDGDSWYTLTESYLTFSKGMNAAGYPSLFKLSSCLLKVWERAAANDDELINWLYSGFRLDAWDQLNAAGTGFVGTPTVTPTTTTSVGLGHADQAVWPEYLTAYFLAIQ